MFRKKIRKENKLYEKKLAEEEKSYRNIIMFMIVVLIKIN